MVHPIRRGTVRADGKMFWAYRYYNGEKFPRWVTPEQYKKWDQKRIEYVRRKKNAYKEQQAALPPEERNYLGRFDPVTGLYFIQVCTNGKAQFGTLEQLDAYKAKIKSRSRAYHKKCKETYPIPKVCVGDRHPADPNLYVIKIWGNKVSYSTFEKLQKRRENHRQKDLLYRLRNKETIIARRNTAKAKLSEFLKQHPEMRMKRGYINPITKEIFWFYDNYGREIWLSPEQYHRRRQKECLARKLRRRSSQ